MCTTYCPNEIDVAGLMNHLKNAVVSSRKRPAEYEIAAFQEVFIDVLKRHGRINDLQLMQRFMLKTFLHGHPPGIKALQKDLALAVELYRRDRLRLLPEHSRGAPEVRRILGHFGRKGVSS